MHRKIPDFKSVYGRSGFREYQPLVQNKDAVARILKLCQDFRSESLLCALKLHRQDDFPLSFAGPGYSIGIDIRNSPNRREQITAFSNALEKSLSDFGGMLYLAKNDELSNRAIARMYPGVSNVLKAKRRWDPVQVFSSNMFRRLIPAD